MTTADSQDQGAASSGSPSRPPCRQHPTGWTVLAPKSLFSVGASPRQGQGRPFATHWPHSAGCAVFWPPGSTAICKADTLLRGAGPFLAVLGPWGWRSGWSAGATHPRSQSEDEAALPPGLGAPHCSASSTATRPPCCHHRACYRRQLGPGGWEARSPALVSHPELSTAPARGPGQEAGGLGASWQGATWRSDP